MWPRIAIDLTRNSGFARRNLCSEKFIWFHWKHNLYIFKLNLIVSHTVHDLRFIWNMTDPLVVNPEIELPQLDIANNYTSDCTIEYSTGKPYAYLITILS